MAANLISRKDSPSCVALESLDVDIDEKLGGLLLSWNYRREILAKLRARTSNARVLIPLPTVEQISLE